MAEFGEEFRNALLREKDWELRLKQTILFTQRRINSLRWKRGYTGPLPDGHDANSIAAEAIRQLFEGNCQIDRLPYTSEQLGKEIMRLVSNLTHNLLRRKETAVTSSEHDLSPASEGEEEDFGFERIGGDSPQADKEAVRNEAKAKLARFKYEFMEFLGKDVVLQELFDCICVGIVKREEISELLGVEPQMVTNSRKRLDRRLAEFALNNPSYPATFIQEVIHA